MNDYYCYVLIDPRTDTPFYVGKGKRNRMYRHVQQVKAGKIPHRNKHLFSKISQILEGDQSPVYQKIVECVSSQEAYKVETETIAKIGRSNLCNLTDGGDGPNGFKQEFTPEWKAKISRARKGKPSNRPNYTHSVETREKISAAQKAEKNHNYGKPPWNLGVTLSDETRQKMSKSAKARKLSDETKAKLSLRAKEQWAKKRLSIT